MKKKSTTKTLVILDAHAIIHRAYHALPSFANSQGVPTGALYGITSMVLRIIEELKPDYMVAAYDLPKPTFRHHAYDAYKAGRAKADDDLVAQIKTSRDLMKAFGIECLDAEGFEADDVIGTLVEQYKDDKDVSIVIASGDMDTLQLVRKKEVRVFTLKKGVQDTVIYDEEGVKERYGFMPLQLVDYKGLRGDPSDNIIGVPGIGEKTATSIIQVFGSIEKLYVALEKNDEAKLKSAGLTARIIGILREHKDDAFFSKTLATIRRDAPVSYPLPDVSYTASINEESLVAQLTEYEFRSLVPRVRKVFHFEQVIASAEPVDETLLRTAAIGLWVLYSDDTNATLERILERTRTKNLEDAYTAIQAELKKRKLDTLFEKLELPLVPIIQQMETTGIMIDRAHFEHLRETMKSKLAGIEKEIIAVSGHEINLNSPKQLSELLFVKLGLKPKGKQKASGAFTTNAETLEGLRGDHPMVAMILEYRETQKLLTTYVEALLTHAKADDRVHATFLQNGTTTGRFSSTNPNLQNIPAKGEGGKEVRHGFVAGKGNIFVGCDYSQIELRVLAMLSGDEALMQTFIKGEDIHAAVASRVFGVAQDEVTSDMRRKAKVINFGIIYGMGVSALQKNLGTTREEAQTFYNNYFAAFPTIAAYLESIKSGARETGYTETVFGRRRYFPGISNGPQFMRAMAERMAGNAPIQGAAADIIKIAITLVDQDTRAAGLEDGISLVLQVHDELVYEVKEEFKEKAQELIVRAMESVFERTPIALSIPTVPLKVSIGNGARLDELK